MPFLAFALMGLVSVASGEQVDVTARAGTETFSCNSTATNCTFYVTADCQGCDTTFNCPNETCTECIVECDGDNSCRGATINAFECDTLRVSAVSGDRPLFSTIINGDNAGDVYIDVPQTGIDAAVNIEVYCSSVTNDLTIACEGSCREGIIECPENSNSPTCFISCLEDGGNSCEDMTIGSAGGTPHDVKLSCTGTGGLICDGATINCTLGEECTMVHNAVDDSWACGDTACNTPSLAPSEIPSEIPSSQPTIFPSMNPTSLPTEVTLIPSSQPSAIPSSDPTSMPSVSSTEPTVMLLTSTSEPLDNGPEISTTTINADRATSMSPTSMPILLDGLGGDNNNNEDEIDYGILSIIIIAVTVGVLCIVGFVVFAIKRNEKQTDSQDVETKMEMQVNASNPVKTGKLDNSPSPNAGNAEGTRVAVSGATNGMSPSEMIDDMNKIDVLHDEQEQNYQSEQLYGEGNTEGQTQTGETPHSPDIDNKDAPLEEELVGDSVTNM